MKKQVLEKGKLFILMINQIESSISEKTFPEYFTNYIGTFKKKNHEI